MQGSTVQSCVYSFLRQNCSGLFTRGFLLHVQARFNGIVYLGYISYKNGFFYSEFSNISIILNLNQSQQQPNYFMTLLM